MKKVGTITTAVAFIFYGIWLTISNTNYDLALKIFKWWPIIFCLLGLEMLYADKKQKNTVEKRKFNYLIILVVLIFIFTNLYLYTKNTIRYFERGKDRVEDKYKNYFKKGFESNLKGLELWGNDSKEVHADAKLDSYGKEIKVDLPNSKIRVKNSKDNKIFLDFKVYVNKSNYVKKYDIHSEKTNDGYKINFPEAYVNGVDGVIYVPKGFYVKINGDNLKLDGEDFNGDIDVDGSNCELDLYGDIKKSVIDISNGKINFNNKECKDIKINASNATVTVKTEDKNFKSKVDMNNGVSHFNGEKRVNSGFSKVLGKGEGNLNIDINNGVINIKSGE